MATQQEFILAILFADVCDSTRLYEEFGDHKARSAIARCVEIMADATRNQGGRVVKTIGDEVMCTFPAADSAVAAAVDMQERISGELVVDDKPVAIRVGFNVGRAIVEANDVFGDAVNLASRLASVAKPEQILTTAETVGRMSEGWKVNTRQVDRASVKGRRDQVDFYEVIWRVESVTWVTPADWMALPAEQQAKLVLERGGQAMEVSEARPSLTVGRDDQNTLVIKDRLVSRFHARIDFRNGRFFLIDSSINGTYIITPDSGLVRVRRDSRLLDNAGVLSFGRIPAEQDPGLIHFRVSH